MEANDGQKPPPQHVFAPAKQLELVEVLLQASPDAVNVIFYDAANDVAVMLATTAQLGMGAGEGPRAMGISGFIVAKIGALNADGVNDYLHSALFKLNLEGVSHCPASPSSQEMVACKIFSMPPTSDPKDLEHESFATLITFKASDVHLNVIEASVQASAAALHQIDQEESGPEIDLKAAGDSGAPSVH